jgi:TolB-like protein
MHKDGLFRFPIDYVLMFKVLLFLWIITALYIGPVQARDYLLDDGIEEIKNQISKQINTMGVKSLAILDFTDISGKDDLFGRYLSEKLIIALFNLEGITVVERSKLNQVLSEHERQQVGLIDPKTTKKIGQFLGIDSLLIGTVTDMGGSLEVIGRLVNTETARIQAVTSLSFVKDGKTEMLYRQGQGTPVGQIAPVRIFPGGFMDPFTSMIFVFVKGGCFFMGDTFDEGDRDEKPVHEVCVNDFYMGKYEVTQGQWEKIMRNNPSRFSYGIHYPVEEVGWNDAYAFIEKLNHACPV